MFLLGEKHFENVPGKGLFQNAILIRWSTNIDRKSHHLFGWRMIVLASHTSPSVDLPPGQKFLHRDRGC